MFAKTNEFLDFLNQTHKLRIPIYQRKYSWNLKQCNELWEDIIRIGKDENIDNTHFIGSVVYIKEEHAFPGELNTLLIIDGQQRLTTISLIICALCKVLKENLDIENIDHDKLVSYYLLNEKEKGDDKYKLILTQDDEKSLKKIINNVSAENDSIINFSNKDSIRIKENFEFFKNKINSVDLKNVYNGILKLIIVYIDLEKGKDKPQLIFESLNSTGLELNQADLIRNYILMDLDKEEQEDLYNSYWHEMELKFGHSENSSLLDNFLRDYLTIKLDKIPTFKGIYTAFKEYSKNWDDINSLVKDIFNYSEYFVKMIFNEEEDEDINFQFKNLNNLKHDVVRPFVLSVYIDYKIEKITKEDFIEILKMAESYILRRNICDIPTNSLNKTFSSLYRKIDKTNYLDSIKAILLSYGAYRRFPDDDEFKNKFLIKDIYNSRTRNFILGRIENSYEKYAIDVEKLTIEHIMPQNPNLKQEWKDSLGSDWKQVQKNYLHTIGNLTLINHQENSKLSDKPFIEKRDMFGGFKATPLILNRDLANYNTWNEELIIERANSIIKLACDIWPYPKLNKEIRDKYEENETKRGRKIYSINDHEFLHEEPVKSLFEELRKRILNINSMVKEEPKKQYIAYKALTNFVDVIPYKSSLNLSLSIPFDRIKDPERKCRDVEGIGRWGNGDTDFKLTSFDDLNYALNLIEQAFDYIISDEDLY